MNSAIETELLKASDLKIKKKEDRQMYLHRLVDVVQDLDDDTWKGLSTDAQNWVNECATEIKNDGEDATLPDFPDIEDEEEAVDDAEGSEEDEGETEEEGEEESEDVGEDEPADESTEEESDVNEEDVKPAKRPAKKAAAKSDKNGSAKKAPPAKAAKPEKKPEKKAAPKAEKKPAQGPKATGIKVKIKKIVFKNPTISIEDLMERLGKDGVKPSKLTVSAIRSEFRHTLFVLKDLDALKSDVKL